VTSIVRLSGGPPRTREILDVLGALEGAVLAADPARLVSDNLKLEGETLRVSSLRFDLARFRRVMVIGGGKAAGKMALELERLLGDGITAGVVNLPDYQKLPESARIAFHPSSHPLPSSSGVRGVRRMLELVGEPSAEDLVICLLSGGGSALLPLPLPGVTIGDEAQVTKLLLRSGADIIEINTVRKHLSSIKGGRLAERLFPATVISLIISDVVGDRVDTIASGPTAPDRTSYRDAKKILVGRRVWDEVSSSVRSVIGEGIEGTIKETPKPGSRIFRKVHNVVIGNNRVSLVRAGDELRKKRYETTILSGPVTGEAREAGFRIARMIRARTSRGAPWALIGGGETVVTVRGAGSGGRNQEFVLSAALGVQGTGIIAVGSIATDGIDGPTDAAGAIADSGTVAKGRSRGLEAKDYLERNDSYPFFKKLGDLITTGPTGTNVNDVFVAVGRPPVSGAPRAART
jgi:glycerate 2-kinase